MENRQTESRESVSIAGKASDRAGEKNIRAGAILSRCNNEKEVIFLGSGDKKILAKLNEDRTAIEFFSIDQNMIKKGIEMAKASGQIPLKIYGTPEFIQAAETEADLQKIQISDRKTPAPAVKYAPPAPIDQRSERLKNRLAALDLAVETGNIKPAEFDWRAPLKIKEWIASEIKIDPTIKADDLLERAKEADKRITEKMIDEVKNKDEIETKKTTDEEKQKWKM